MAARRAEPDLLAACYRASLRLAEAHGIGSIAFPAIGCGVYGYPPESAVQVAVHAVRDWPATHALPERVLFCCFGAGMALLYRATLQAR